MKRNLLSGKKIGTIVLMLTVIVVFSCTTAGKSVDSEAAAKLMAQFDRVYIPVLSMTSKGDAKKTEKAISFLIEEWTKLKPQFYVLFQGNKTSERDISEINNLIIDAVNEFAGGVELAEIHETLEKIKKPFENIRTRNHIDYYLDSLEEYHAVMEKILDITAAKSPEDLTSHDIGKIHKLALKGLDQLSRIANASFDRTLFGFDQGKTDKLMAGIKNCIKEEEKFISVVEEGDSSAIIAEAGLLKSYYTKVYLLFGDFSHIK